MKNLLLLSLIYALSSATLSAQDCGFGEIQDENNLELLPAPDTLNFWDGACVGELYEKTILISVPDILYVNGIELEMDSMRVISANLVGANVQMDLGCTQDCVFLGGEIGYFNIGYTPTVLGGDSINIEIELYFDSAVLPFVVINYPDETIVPGQMSLLVSEQGSCTPQTSGSEVCFSASSTSVCDSTAVNFYNYTNGLNLTSNWSFPGGTPATSTEAFPTVYYYSPGTYDVTLIISDGVDSDTLTKTDYINVYNDASCYEVEAYFSASDRNICDSNYVDFRNLSVGRSTIAFSWEFPGGVPVTSTAEEPSVYYPFPGNYSATLIAYNGQNSDTLTRTNYITVYSDSDPQCSNGNADCIDYSQIDLGANCSTYEPVCGCDGNEYQNPCIALNCFGVTWWTDGPCDDPGNNGGGGTPSDSTCTVTASFEYTGVLDPFPTYEFASTATGGDGEYYYFWDMGDGTTYNDSLISHTFNLADSLGAYSVCLEVFDFSGCFSYTCETVVIDGSPGGSIAGQLTEGSNLQGENPSIEQRQGSGDPIPNVQVDRIDALGNVMATTYTNSNGEYSFNELLFGNYQIQVVISGIPHQPAPTKLDPTKQRQLEFSFEVNDTDVTPTGINATNLLESARLYPNPTKRNTLLELTLGAPIPLEITARNILGQTVYATQQEMLAGKQQLTLPSATWGAGLYLVSLQSGESVLSLKLVVE